MALRCPLKWNSEAEVDAAIFDWFPQKQKKQKGVLLSETAFHY
jgi:hypothetical protein